LSDVTQAVVLAAGVGRRLGALGRGRAKCLLTVGGRSLLDRTFAAIARSGIRRAIVAVGHCREAVEPAVAAGARRYGLDTRIVPDPLQVGGMTSLWLARPVLDETFLVMESNVLLDPSLLSEIVAVHADRQPLATMGLTPKHTEARTHIWVDVDGERAVAGWERSEKPDFVAGDGIRWIYTGVGVVRRDVLEAGPTHEDVCQALAAAMVRGERVDYVEYHGPFNHIATPFCLARARQHFLEQRSNEWAR
jgi:NDP-sugar pyrophosphorylase family protein